MLFQVLLYNAVAYADQIDPADIPEGFEGLLEPQTGLVDVYYAGSFLGSFFAEYSPSGLRFLEPEKLVEHVDLIESKIVADILRDKLPTNTGLVCTSAGTNCGRLEPENVGLIFDEASFKVDIFFSSQLLKVSPAITSRYLPEPDAANSVVQNFAVVASGDNQGNDRASLTGASLFANGPQHVKSAWSVNTDYGFTVEELYYRNHFPDTAVTAGVFRPQISHSTFLRGDVLVGGEYRTAIDRRTDLDVAMGTAIQVFVPSKARVNILREGKLVATGIYDAGNKQLDTSILPHGAYEIEIEVIENSGRINRERRFYVKNAELPPLGERFFNAQIGQLRRVALSEILPESLDINLAAGGMGHRFTENWGGYYGATFTGEGYLLEGNALFLDNGFQAKAGLMTGSDGVSGFSSMLASQYRRWSTNINLLKVNGLEVNDRLFPVVQTSSTQLGVSGSHPLFGGNVGVRYSFSEQNDGEKTELYSLSYAKPLWSSATDSLIFRTELSASDEESLVYAKLTWSRTRNNQAYRLEPELGYRENEVDNIDSGYAQLGFNSRWYNDSHARNAYVNEVSGQLGGDNPYLQGTSQYAGELGRFWGSIAATESDINEDTRLSYAGRYDASLLYAGGLYAWGGRSRAESGVIIAVEGEENPNSVQKLVVDGSVVAKATPGKSLVLGLKPFDTYKVLLNEGAGGFYDIDGGTQSATLYPGTVSVMRWGVSAIDLLAGRLISRDAVCMSLTIDRSKCKIPTGPGRLTGGVGPAFVGEQGYFQIEVQRGTKSLTLDLYAGGHCIVNLPDYATQEGVAFMGDLSCEVVAGKAVKSSVSIEQ